MLQGPFIWGAKKGVIHGWGLGIEELGKLTHSSMKILFESLST
jgi:hypothetical protein